jgi:hypothetical protein
MISPGYEAVGCPVCGGQVHGLETDAVASVLGQLPVGNGEPMGVVDT